MRRAIHVLKTVNASPVTFGGSSSIPLWSFVSSYVSFFLILISFSSLKLLDKCDTSAGICAKGDNGDRCYIGSNDCLPSASSKYLFLMGYNHSWIYSVQHRYCLTLKFNPFSQYSVGPGGVCSQLGSGYLIGVCYRWALRSSLQPTSDSVL